MSVWVKEKGSSSMINDKKRRWGGREAGGVHHLGRVTAWPRAHWEGLWQRRDTGDAGGTLSPFVTAAPMKTAAPLPSLHPLPSQSLHPPSPPCFIRSLCDYPHPLAFLPPPSDLPHSTLSSYLFLIHPHDSTLLIPWTVSASPSSKFAVFLWSPNLFLLCSLLLNLIYPASPPLRSPIPFPLQNHPWYLFGCHQPGERWKSILPPATAPLWLRRKGRQLAGLSVRPSIHLPLRSVDKAVGNQCSTDCNWRGTGAEEQEWHNKWLVLNHKVCESRSIISPQKTEYNRPDLILKEPVHPIY